MTHLQFTHALLNTQSYVQPWPVWGGKWKCVSAHELGVSLMSTNHCVLMYEGLCWASGPEVWPMSCFMCVFRCYGPWWLVHDFLCCGGPAVYFLCCFVVLFFSGVVPLHTPVSALACDCPLTLFVAPAPHSSALLSAEVGVSLSVCCTYSWCVLFLLQRWKFWVWYFFEGN